MTRFRVAVPVRWSDLDAYGHVNNARMLTLLEEARIAAFWGDTAGGSPTAVLKTGPDADLLMFIASQRIEYLAPMPHHRELLDVEMWFGRLGGASMEVCYEVFSPVGHEPRILYVRAATTVVTVDRETGSPRRLPAEARAAWEHYRDEPIAFRS